MNNDTKIIIVRAGKYAVHEAVCPFCGETSEVHIDEKKRPHFIACSQGCDHFKKRFKKNKQWYFVFEPMEFEAHFGRIE